MEWQLITQTFARVFMTRQEKEALRRIRKVKETGALALDLSELYHLNRPPPELKKLTSLQSLSLSGCQQLSGDLSPLASLTKLQWLNLSFCRQVSDLSPLAGLASLRTLRLDHWRGNGEFAPLKSLLPTLQHLSLYDCKLDDLPREVCGETPRQNVLGKVRFNYRQRPGASTKTIKNMSPGTPSQIFVSYAWEDMSPVASEEDRQRQGVVERL